MRPTLVTKKSSLVVAIAFFSTFLLSNCGAFKKDEDKSAAVERANATYLGVYQVTEYTENDSDCEKGEAISAPYKFFELAYFNDLADSVVSRNCDSEASCSESPNFKWTLLDDNEKVLGDATVERGYSGTECNFQLTIDTFGMTGDVLSIEKKFYPGALSISKSDCQDAVLQDEEKTLRSEHRVAVKAGTVACNALHTLTAKKL